MTGQAPTLACRPSEIDLARDGGVRGLIKRRVPLGDTIDYRVMVGAAEVRVQRNVRKPMFAEGERCGLCVGRLYWY